MTKLVHVGFGNYLVLERIVGIAIPASAPIKRVIREERDNTHVIDLTCGRKVKSVIFTDSAYIVLSTLEPVTVGNRIEVLN